MNILQALVRLRDDLKLWVTNNLQALKDEVDKKSEFSGDYNDLTNKPDIDGEINNRVESVENDITILDDELNGVKEEIATIENDISTNRTNISVLNANLSVLDGSIASVDDAVVELESDVSTFKNNFNTHKNNADIHVTKTDKDGWNAHAIDDVSHVTGADKDTWNEHVENNAIHVVESDKTRWNNKSDFSGNYNDLEDAPDISDDGTGQLKFVDEAGNIIMQLDDQGLHSTNLELTKNVSAVNASFENLDAKVVEINGVDVLSTMDSKVSAKFAELVDSAPDTLDTLNELATALGNDPNFATTIVEQLGLKANKTDIPTKVSQLQNDENYLTEVPDDYMTEIEINDLLIPINAHISLSEKNIATNITNIATNTANIATLTADNTVEGSVDNKIKVSMDNEIIARVAGDKNSLNSAKSYTDQQIGVEVTARNNADAATLSSAKDYTDEKIAALEIPRAVTTSEIDAAFSAAGL
jgi:hypothetical protein